MCSGMWHGTYLVCTHVAEDKRVRDRTEHQGEEKRAAPAAPPVSEWAFLRNGMALADRLVSLCASFSGDESRHRQVRACCCCLLSCCDAANQLATHARQRKTATLYIKGRVSWRLMPLTSSNTAGSRCFVKQTHKLRGRTHRFSLTYAREVQIHPHTLLTVPVHLF